jgi:hypothetical protein
MKRKPITAAMKLEVLMKLGRWECYRCCKEFWLSDMQWDHVQALVDGGTHEPSNLRPVCIPCHRDKSAFEHVRNSKGKRLTAAQAIHAAIIAGDMVRARSKIPSRPFPKRMKK